LPFLMPREFRKFAPQPITHPIVDSSSPYHLSQGGTCLPAMG
jgi:hypothetical protein